MQSQDLLQLGGVKERDRLPERLDHQLAVETRGAGHTLSPRAGPVKSQRDECCPARWRPHVERDAPGSVTLLDEIDDAGAARCRQFTVNSVLI
jgi:hypothetical protein